MDMRKANENMYGNHRVPRPYDRTGRSCSVETAGLGFSSIPSRLGAQEQQAWKYTVPRVSIATVSTALCLPTAVLVIMQSSLGSSLVILLSFDVCGD